MRFSELDGKSVAIWGAGRETRAFAVQLVRRLPAAHLRAVVLDDPSEDVSGPGLDGVPIISTTEAERALTGCDVLVRSPGVSIHRPELLSLAASGVQIHTSTGLWLAERAGRHVIGVTGTKGKSTTATIIHHLSSQVRPTELAGNIGRPAIDLLDAPEDLWIVLELSSYQIADLPLAPQFGVITNLYREHVDWHGSEAAYRSEKLSLFTRPGMEAAAFPPGDGQLEAALAHVPRRFGVGTPDGWHVNTDGTAVCDGRGSSVELGAFPLKGRHNAENLCAALAVLDAAGLDLPALPEGFGGLRALAHRLQTVHVADGVEWVDDSISTTPESSLAALSAYPGRVILIAGGQDREQDYRALASAVVDRGAVLITLPLTGSRLATSARDAGIPESRLIEATDMAAAVTAARDRAEPGTTVLLSPAAPSYHVYMNFEARGDHFASLSRQR